MTTDTLDDVQSAAADRELLQKVVACLPILADLSRSDLLLYTGDGSGPVTVIAQAQPHSVSPIFTGSMVGQPATEDGDPALFRALRRGRVARDTHEVTERAVPSFQEVYPVRTEDDRVLGALCIETNLMEHERHQRRNQVFRDALAHLQQMVVRGRLRFEEPLSPFGEHDGIIVVDADGVIQYISGIATNLYRKVGRSENLVGTAIADLPTDAQLCEAARTSDQCIEHEFEEGGFTWIKKAIPIRVAAGGTGWLLGRFLPASPSTDSHWGVLLTIHDATETRRKERELRIKSAMIQEIHHRVKNNLQTIAALLRLQARRSESEETQQVLQTTINRILSIAVVHEFLAQAEGAPINMEDVARQVIHQLRRSIVDPERQIQLNLYSDDLYLPAQQATACALVINELIQNALEHGFVGQDSGAVVIRLHARRDMVVVEVMDNGIGLPPGFDIQRDGSLGLRIVQTLVEDDLKGALQLHNGRGVRAIVTFPKAPLSQALSPIGDL